MYNSNLVPAVLQAVVGDDFTVYAYMNDGSIHHVDIKPMIERGNIFSKLADIEFFKTVTVMNDSVAWDLSGCRDPYNCIDLDPFMIAECPVADDPLA